MGEIFFCRFAPGFAGYPTQDHQREIRATAVNRSPHDFGYAYPYLALYEPLRAEGQAPPEIGRAQFEAIALCEETPPRPASAPVIRSKVPDGLLNFFPAIHHKGTVLNDGLIDRLAAEYQHSCAR